MNIVIICRQNRSTGFAYLFYDKDFMTQIYVGRLAK